LSEGGYVEGRNVAIEIPLGVLESVAITAVASGFTTSTHAQWAPNPIRATPPRPGAPSLNYVTTEYRRGLGQYDRAQALTAELVHRRVAVVATVGDALVIAAKAATSTLSRCGGNVHRIRTGHSVRHPTAPMLRSVALYGSS
jgi:hypothetical protein